MLKVRAVGLLVSLGLLLLLFSFGQGRGSFTRLCAEAPCQEEVLQPQVARETSPDIAETELAELVSGNTAFALGLYQRLREQGGNLFYSPYSISLALAMTYAGARGETARQMAMALHFTLPQERLHPAFNALDLAITSREGEGIKLNVANAFWGQLGHPFLQEYIDLLAKHYGAEIRLLSFASTAEACRQHINSWVREKTEGKIEELLPSGSIGPLTRLVLTNAIYFKGTWKWQFDPERTREGPFKLLDGSTVMVPFMVAELEIDRLNYAWGEGYQALELAYTGEKLSMVILLPDLERFAGFESSLDPERLKGILQGLKPNFRKTVVLMPKFSFTSGFGLKAMLSALGMPEAFSRKADFSGMDGTRELWIDDAYHKAFINVNEEGTEAAAATGVVVRGLAAPPEVRVNHPFIFLIRDRETGAILFLGRVLNPAA